MLRLCQREDPARQPEHPARREQGKAFGARTLSPVTPCPDARALLWMYGRQRASCPRAVLCPSWEPTPARARGLSSPLSRLSRNSAACSRTWMLLATGSMSATAAGEREGRGCWPWQRLNHFCFNVTDTVPQTQGPPRPRPPRPGPAPGNRGRPALPRPSRLFPPSLSGSTAPTPGDRLSVGSDSLDTGCCELPTLLPPAVARVRVARARGRGRILGAGREPPSRGWLARGPALSRRGAPARAGKAAGFKFENPDGEGGGERRGTAMRTRLRRGAGAGHGPVRPASAPRGSSASTR